MFANDKRIGVPVKPNEKALSYEGVVKAPTASTFIVMGEHRAQFRATTPAGVHPATRKTPGASVPFKTEKAAKGLINGAADDDGFSVIVGGPLAIVPVTNPATIKLGDGMTVKVLLNGQPVATNVYATCDGFSTEENTCAYYTEWHSDGTAKVKIIQPGLWMVRTQYAAAFRLNRKYRL